MPQPSEPGLRFRLDAGSINAGRAVLFAVAPCPNPAFPNPAIWRPVLPSQARSDRRASCSIETLAQAERSGPLPVEPDPRLGTPEYRDTRICTDGRECRAVDGDEYIEVKAGAWYLVSPGTVVVEGVSYCAR